MGTTELPEEPAVCTERGGLHPPPMPSESVSYGFGRGSLPVGTPTEPAQAKPVSLMLEQYVSPSVIDREAKASRPQRGNA